MKNTNLNLLLLIFTSFLVTQSVLAKEVGQTIRRPAQTQTIFTIEGLEYGCYLYMQDYGKAAAKKSMLDQAKQLNPKLPCTDINMSTLEDALIKISPVAFKQCASEPHAPAYQKYFIEGFAAGAKSFLDSVKSCD